MRYLEGIGLFLNDIKINNIQRMALTNQKINKFFLLFPKLTNIDMFGLDEQYKSTNLLEFCLYLQ